MLGTLGDVRTAILCSGDIYALNIMRYFKAHKIKTPRDVGIMGFDNISILEYLSLIHISSLRRTCGSLCAVRNSPQG